MTSGDDLRGLMRRFPSGIAVLTVELEGERLGLTVGSLVSLSLEPPLVGVSIGRQTTAHEVLRRADGFALSFLGGEQEALAQHFARSGMPPVVMWNGIEIRPGDGPTLLEGATGWIECRRTAEHTVGDHTLFVGEVLSAEAGASARPLVYLDGRYVPV